MAAEKATYAIVKTGGKQYKVAVGDVVKVEKLESEPGAKVSLPVALVVDGANVTTIEGLAPDDEHLTPLQDAFIRYGGFQCGICTPGQIIAATALLEEHPRPTAEQVRHWMTGNLCRCTGYYKIVESILAAAESIQSGTGAVRREDVGVR